MGDNHFKILNPRAGDGAAGIALVDADQFEAVRKKILLERDFPVHLLAPDACLYRVYSSRDLSHVSGDGFAVQGAELIGYVHEDDLKGLLPAVHRELNPQFSE